LSAKLYDTTVTVQFNPFAAPVRHITQENHAMPSANSPLAKNGLNPAQLAFIGAYLTNGFNASAAYREAYPESAAKSAESNAARLIGNDKVIDEIERRVGLTMASNEVDCDFVIGNLRRLATGAEKDADRLKALDMLGRYLNLWSDRPAPTMIQFNIDLNHKPDCQAGINSAPAAP
jgi:hypothetical protein